LVSFGFCLWQGGTRRPAIGDLRVMRRSEDAIQALRPSEPPPRAGGRNEEPQPPHGQGGASRPAIWTRRESQLNNSGNRKVLASRDAPPCSWDDRGSRRRVLRCTAPRMAISGNPPTTPSSAFMLSSPPRHTTSAARSSAARTYTRRPRQPHAPPCYPRAPLRSRPTRAHTHTSSSRNDEPARVVPARPPEMSICP
jgi:hypothetical protein